MSKGLPQQFWVVKNWRLFQHYKDRSPPWIKLQRSLLDDFDFQRLQLASKALAPMIWLLASEETDGKIPASTEWLAFRLRWPEADVIAGVKGLIEKGFLIDASGALASCLQDATPETEGEGETEVETEKENSLRSSKKNPVLSKRGTRLSTDWSPSDEDRSAALAIGVPTSEIANVADRFRDFWIAKPGADGCKLDWSATWRNWCRSEVQRRGWGAAGPPRLHGPPRERTPQQVAIDVYHQSLAEISNGH